MSSVSVLMIVAGFPALPISNGLVGASIDMYGSTSFLLILLDVIADWEYIGSSLTLIQQSYMYFVHRSFL